MNHIPHHTPAPEPATWSTMSTFERRIAVSELAATSHSGAEIANRLGTSRSAIVGFCFRAKIRLGGVDPMRLRPPPPFPIEPAVPASTWEPLHKPVASPTRKQCCWPVGEATGARQVFCGGVRVRGSYCAHHARVAYAPRSGDVGYSDMLRDGLVLGGVDPEISREEAISLVRGKEKRKWGAE